MPITAAFECSFNTGVTTAAATAWSRPTAIVTGNNTASTGQVDFACGFYFQVCTIFKNRFFASENPKRSFLRRHSDSKMPSSYSCETLSNCASRLNEEFLYSSEASKLRFDLISLASIIVKVTRFHLWNWISPWNWKDFRALLLFYIRLSFVINSFEGRTIFQENCVDTNTPRGIIHETSRYSVQRSCIYKRCLKVYTVF